MVNEIIINLFAEKIWKWFQEEHLHITISNIHRYFALKHPKQSISEKNVTAIWNRIGEIILG